MNEVEAVKAKVSASKLNICCVKPINRRSVTRVFERVGQSVNPRVKLGTHYMRKTRGYVMHKAGMRIEEISKALGHSHTAVTMAYIGLDVEAVRRSFLEFEL